MDVIRIEGMDFITIPDYHAPSLNKSHFSANALRNEL